MAVHDWHLYLFLASTGIALGLWLVPCILMSRRPTSKHFQVDECSGEVTQSPVPLVNDSFLARRASPRMPAYKSYLRTGNRTIIAERYALFFQGEEVKSFAVQMTPNRGQVCRVLLSCGETVVKTTAEAWESVLNIPCWEPPGSGRTPTSAALIRCGNSSDCFFWTKDKEDTTKALFLGGNKFACSSRARCSLDRDPYLGSHFFRLTEAGGSCGTRVFGMKGVVPLSLKLSGVL